MSGHGVSNPVTEDPTSLDMSSSEGVPDLGPENEEPREP